jgi:O-6-methylguanine DNA methyltransferase
MNDHLTDRLAALRDEAPAALLPNVLAEVGLADRYIARNSPIGRVFVAFNDRGVSAVNIGDSPEDFEQHVLDTLGRRAVPAEELPPSLAARLDRAITEGKPGGLPLDLSSITEFQARVLLKTAEIPSGEVRPYGWVAREIGSPGATRAVGTALAQNPVPVIVPCHRVVRSDGRLGEYSMGDTDNKRRLLEAEGLDVDALEDLAARGVRFIGSDTTHIFCHPSCKDASRITDRHLVEFRSARAAAAAGYRACKRCRPAVAA